MEYENILIFVLYVIGLYLVFRITKNIQNTVRQAKISNDGGKTLSPPTREEREALARHLMFQKTKLFWYLLAIGFLLISLCWLTLHLLGYINYTK